MGLKLALSDFSSNRLGIFPITEPQPWVSSAFHSIRFLVGLKQYLFYIHNLSMKSVNTRITDLTRFGFIGETESITWLYWLFPSFYRNPDRTDFLYLIRCYIYLLFAIIFQVITPDTLRPLK